MEQLISQAEFLLRAAAFNEANVGRAVSPAYQHARLARAFDAISSFCAELDLDAFRADRKTVYAVVRALEIISEASRRLPEQLLERHPEIDWPAVAAAGNI